ncbi:MAG TPA: ribosome silencing factor [Longimicrobiaceae bacterium]|nr:ribosome silencing factor [Longimicrobiaceae bacterium]
MSEAAVAPEALKVPQQVRRAVDLLLDRKATDVVVLDLDRLSSATDWFVIATGRSDTHVTAIADNLIGELKNEGVRPVNVEGLRGGRWVLVDYFDFVVHVFHPAAREFYQLERLWGDAPQHHVAPEESGSPAS